MDFLEATQFWLPARKLFWIAFAIVSSSAASVSSEPTGLLAGRQYELIDLGTLGGPTSVALAGDETGKVVGWSITAADERRAFVWTAEQGMQALGTLQNGTYSEATAISASGEWVAGRGGIRPDLQPEQFRDVEQGFVVAADGVMQSVGALYNPATVNTHFGTSEVRGVNDLGQAVGSSIVLRQGLHSAFFWENGVMTDIGHANDTAFDTRAFDISNRGQVVGAVLMNAAEGSPPRAFSWEQGTFTYLPDAGASVSSTAAAVNENGQIAGWSGDGEHTVAVLWSGDDVAELGSLPGDASSRALDLNDAGQVVGWSGSEDQSRAFFWEGGTMTDLNSLLAADSGWTLTEATDVSNRGAITGTGLKDGQRRAFQLRPIQVRSCR